MIVDLEKILKETVQTRFHDWLIYNPASSQISPQQLSIVIENCEVFEFCSDVAVLEYITVMYDSYLLKDVHSVLVKFPREYAQESMMLYIRCLLVVLSNYLLLVSQILDINRLFTSEFSRNFKLFFDGKVRKNLEEPKM